MYYETELNNDGTISHFVSWFIPLLGFNFDRTFQLFKLSVIVDLYDGVLTIGWDMK